MEAKYTSSQIIRTGKELTSVLIELCNSSNNIGAFIREYLQELNSEHGSYRKESEAMDRFVSSNESIQREADSMIQTSRSNSVEIERMCSEFESLNAKITEVQKKRKDMDENVETLNKQIKEISAFIKDIQEVSEQTNLLSFNASIEAARAGVAGKGFRIIANEVKNLSERTKSLSGDIQSKVNELQGKVQNVLAETHSQAEFMDSLQQTTLNANSHLVKISTDSRENADFTENVIEQIRSNQQDVIAITKEVEQQNFASVSKIANYAAEDTVRNGDQLSFLYELKALFAYIEEHPSIFSA